MHYFIKASSESQVLPIYPELRLDFILFQGGKILIPNIHQEPDFVQLNQQFGRTSILLIFETKFQNLAPEVLILPCIFGYSALILYWQGLSIYLVQLFHYI